MAAFTTFSADALTRYLTVFDLGDLKHFEPIGTGIENSNYHVHIGDEHECVLTISESLDFAEVAFFNDLFTMLSRNGLPVPAPHQTLDGMTSTSFMGKPTWLFPKLPGAHPEIVTDVQRQEVGRTLAQIHQIARSARYERSNPYSSQWCVSTLEQQHNVSAKDRSLIESLISELSTLEASSNLPRGIVHGDLFRDNALFVDDKLTGVIDFYHACEDFYVMDIAITLNDWTHTELEAELLLGAYQKVRPLEQSEIDHLPIFRKLAAMRFALTRLISGGDGAPRKDPEEFLARLR